VSGQGELNDEERAFMKSVSAFYNEKRAISERVAVYDKAYRGSVQQQVNQLFRQGKSHAEVCGIMAQIRQTGQCA
jgi:hypothetical protein